MALDPVMSSAYIGVKGGFVLISADDPGPHSSQTEQDSRMLAHFAKLPVLDPDSPAQARDLMAKAFAISEKFEIPVMVRPVLRVCHARQNIRLKTPKPVVRPAEFEKNPFRWASIPKMRLALHHALNAKLAKISDYASGQKSLNIWHGPARKGARLGILASGVSAALALDVLREMGLDPERIPFLQTVMPYPLPVEQVRLLNESCQRVLVLEETEPLLEILAPDRKKLLGRLSGHVPSAGELTPERIADVLSAALKEARLSLPKPKAEPIKVKEEPPLRRPNLCPGCSHRAVFYTLRKAFPKGIYPSDIGCYTLGMNQGAVDTCHDMGASITFAAALSRTHQMDGVEKPVIATIGDSTFFHSGTTGLLNAVHNGSRFVLVILDNETTSMTGMQPTPESGLTADGHPGRKIDLMGLHKGLRGGAGLRGGPIRSFRAERHPKRRLGLCQAARRLGGGGGGAPRLRGPAQGRGHTPPRTRGGPQGKMHSLRHMHHHVQLPGACGGLRGQGGHRPRLVRGLRIVRGGLPQGGPATCGGCEMSKLNWQAAVAGVGGQGVLFVTKILARAATLRGADILISEVHGMAQRGGPVISHLKAGSFAGPLVSRQEADLLLSLDAGEAVRNLDFIRPGGSLVVNAPEGGFVSEKSAKAITGRGIGLHMVDAAALALLAGNLKGMNVVLLAAAAKCGALPFSVEELSGVLEDMSPPRFLEGNRALFKAGLGS